MVLIFFHIVTLYFTTFSILAISKQLGHKDVKLTLSIYSHLLPEANDYLKEILNNMNK